MCALASLCCHQRGSNDDAIRYGDLKTKYDSLLLAMEALKREHARCGRHERDALVKVLCLLFVVFQGAGAFFFYGFWLLDRSAPRGSPWSTKRRSCAATPATLRRRRPGS